MRRTRTLALVAALVIVAVAAGCGGGTKPTERAEGPAAETTTVPPTSASTTASTAPQSDEEAVLAAVQGYWEAILSSSNPPDRDSPALHRTAAGDALAKALSTIEHRAGLGQAVRLPEATVYHHSPTVESIGGGQAVVIDCGVDDTVLYDYSSGKVLNDETKTTQWRTTLTLEDGTWRVTSNVILQTWDGVGTCGS